VRKRTGTGALQVDLIGRPDAYARRQCRKSSCVVMQHASNSKSAWKWNTVSVANDEEAVDLAAALADSTTRLPSLLPTDDDTSSSGGESSSEDLMAVEETMNRTLDGKVWLRMVKDAQRRHDAQKAREILDIALQRLPTDPSLLLASAKLERTRHHYESARKLFRRCSECHPEFVANYITWSAMEVRLSRPESARAVLLDGLDNVASKKSAFARLTHVLAALERSEGRERSARDALLRGLKMDSVNPFLNQALAVLEYDSGNVSRAQELLGVATRAHPEHVLSWFTRGVIEEAEGDIQKARLSLASGASKKGRGITLLWHAWVALETRSGNRTKARELCELAIRRFPHDSAFCASWAALLMDNGDVPTARKVVKQGLSIDEGCGLLWLAQASIEKDVGDYWKARQAYAAGARKSRSSAVSHAILTRWAVMELCLGEEARAQKLLAQAKAVYGSLDGEEQPIASTGAYHQIANDSFFAKSALSILASSMDHYFIPRAVPRVRRHSPPSKPRARARAPRNQQAAP